MSAFNSDIIDTNASDVKYGKVEDQKQVWDEAIGIGRIMAERLK